LAALRGEAEGQSEKDDGDAALIAIYSSKSLQVSEILPIFAPKIA
jgi:hypothetical protein